MKKIISIVTALIMSIGSIMAQTDYRSVKGYVVDKNGNPIPGAEVTTPGGGESVITDSDGSFNMSVHPLLKKLTASYDGMTTKTLKIKPDKDLVFTLKKERKKPAFLSAAFGLSYNTHGDYYGDELFGPGCNFMAGMLSKWGFYGRLGFDFEADFNVTAGVIKSIYNRSIFIYAGAGYGMAYRYYNYEYYDPYYSYNYSTHTYSGGWINDSDDNYCPGIAADFGFIFKTGRHFNLIIGYNLLSTFSFTVYNDVSVGPTYVHGLQAGIGYVF